MRAAVLAMSVVLPFLSLGQVALANSWNASTSAPLSHTTAAGSNRLLVYVISFEDDDNLNDVTSVSYGGQAMTQATQVTTITGTGSQSRVEIWHLNQSGISLASNTSFTPIFSISNPSVSHGYFAMAVTLSGVNQATPVCSSGTGARLTSSTVNLSAGIPVLPGELMIYGTHTGDIRTHSPAAGYTEAIDLNGAGGGQSASVNHRTIVTAATENPVSTLSSSGNRFVMAAIRVLPAGATCSSPLPIELTRFTLSVEQTMVMIRWQSATEKNNNWYVVQRSADGIAWEDIQRVKGAGNSTGILNYETQDHSPLHGLSYYRLKQIDFDGSYSYSGIESLNYIPHQREKLHAYPNPCASDLFIEARGHLNEVIQVRNIMGQPMTVGLINLSNGLYQLRVRELPSGYYVFQIGEQFAWFIKE